MFADLKNDYEDIKQFKDYFINYLEECNKPATIELQMSSY